MKSLVYSDKRILHPMKRVDFDPDGERNPQNRGKSGYVRISWDEALDIVAKEINRAEARARARLDHLPDVVAPPVGQRRLLPQLADALRQPDRLHPRGRQPRQLGGLVLGRDAPLRQARCASACRRATAGSRTACKEAEMIVFWSCDPGEHQRRLCGLRGHPAPPVGEGARHRVRAHRPALQPDGAAARRALDSRSARRPTRRWPRRSCTSGSPKASTTRTTWPPAPPASTSGKAYLLGETDGVPKTPEWQEAGDRRAGQGRARAGPQVGRQEGLPRRRHDRRRLRRRRPRRDRCAVGALHGHDDGDAGLGQAGRQHRQPRRSARRWTCTSISPAMPTAASPATCSGPATRCNNYQRMPHILTMNPVKQMVPRQQLPDAIINGEATGYLWDGMSPGDPVRALQLPDAGLFARST